MLLSFVAKRSARLLPLPRPPGAPGREELRLEVQEKRRREEARVKVVIVVFIFIIRKMRCFESLNWLQKIAHEMRFLNR